MLYLGGMYALVTYSPAGPARTIVCFVSQDFMGLPHAKHLYYVQTEDVFLSGRHAVQPEWVSSGCDGVFLCDGCVDENFKERCLASLARTGDKNRGGKRTGSTTELWKNAFDWAAMRKYWTHTPSALLSSLD